MVDPELRALLEPYEKDFPMLFIVSQASLGQGEGEYKAGEVEGLTITVGLAEGEKCARCWNRSVSVGTISKAPEICERCSTTIS